jgi:hypothetical protein
MRERAPPTFIACFISLLGLVAFFLVRPALSGETYYRPRPPGTAYDYWYLLLAAFLPYALALRSSRLGHRPALPLVLGAAAVLYVLLIPAPAVQSQDVYQYLAYGEMAAEGENPHAFGTSPTPGRWQTHTLWDGAPSVYGPVWTLATGAVIRLAGGNLLASFLLVKGLAAALALLTALLVARGPLVRNDPARASSFRALVFAFNPLVLFTVGLGAHADVAVAAAFAGAAVASFRDRDGLATFLLIVATMVKAYAGMVLLVWLVALARRRSTLTGLRHLSGAVALMSLVYLLFWEGLRTFSAFAEVGRLASASLVGSVQRLVAGGASDATAGEGSAVAVAVRVVAGIVLVTVFIGMVRSERTPREPWRMAVLAMAAYVLVTPWYLYWHLIGPLALAVVAADEALLAGVLTFSATSLVVAGGSTLFNGSVEGLGLVLQTTLRYGPPVLAVAQANRILSRSTVVPHAR